MINYALLLAVCSLHQINGLSEDDKCINNDNSDGVCKRLDDCKTAPAAVRAGLYPKLCGVSHRKGYYIICCPDELKVNSSLKQVTNKDLEWNEYRGSVPASEIARKKCQEFGKYVKREVQSPIIISSQERTNITVNYCSTIIQPLIVGGIEAKPMEFPHIVAIGYNDSPVQWLCAGSLISRRFVVSAAHCSLLMDKPPLWVKLGELDMATSNDETDTKIFRIIKIYNHPNYNAKTLENDITLFKFEAGLSFNRFIRPICLKTETNIVEDTLIAAGWGAVGFGEAKSSKLLKVQLKLASAQSCRDTYANSTSSVNDRKQLCAGKEKGKDTCQADSGGPLQVRLHNPYCMDDLVGVTSFGKSCGEQYPGVYVRISYYVPWIVHHVWPEM